MKRLPVNTGPYINISFFESLNRIATDLVLLSGATKLFKDGLGEIKIKTIHLRMGVTHGNDFEVVMENGKLILGEAFNAAPSFCTKKMAQAINKLVNQKEGKEMGLIMINEEVKNVIGRYKNNKIEELEKKFD